MANVERSPLSSASSQANAAQAGLLGEDLVRDWLIQTHWQVLEQRWQCRWGELDLIVSDRQTLLAFVEVKVRGRGNWDQNGLLAITPQKQAKLCRAAQMFLADYPDYSTLNCRFDVALVSWKAAAPSRSSRKLLSPPSAIAPSGIKPPISVGCPVLYGDRWFTLEQYIPSAFEAAG